MDDGQDRPAREGERRLLEERAFGPDATPADRLALADFDGRRPAPARAVERGRPSARRRWPILLAAGVAILGAGAGLICGLALRGGQNGATPTDSSTLTAVERTLPPFTAPDFSAQQVAVDLPSGPIPSNLVRSSFRSSGLSDDDSTTANALQVYVARDTTGYDCLIVVHSGQLSSVCVSGRYFPASGLTLAWNEAKGTGIVTWLPDGTMSLSN